MPVIIKFYLSKLTGSLRVFLKWSFFSVVTGIVVGAFSILFAYCMNFVTNFRMEHEQIIYFLPLAGVLIVSLYSLFEYKNDKGTNLVLSTIHAETELPFKMAPLIFISTIITHLFGGSAGREGAALQLGGSIGNQLGRWFRLDEQDRRVIVMCGMSAAFSALFGTPIAAAIFSMEVVSVGVMYYAALVPCAFSSIIATNFAADMGMHGENFKVLDVPAFSPVSGIKIVILAMLCAGLSVLFCMMLHGTGDLYRKYLKNPYLRIVVAGCLVVGLTALLGTTDYNGAGIPVIAKAIEGEVVPAAFFWKMLFTCLTIEAGFKGGEIVPSFFVGATFGCLFGQLAGISPSLCAAVGMASVFCGVTNCPISSMMIAFELFGFKGREYFLIAVAVSYLLSGYYGLYHDQTIVYSKYKTKYVNFKARN
jgi:H+/Cl- antiporter ClcA